MGKNSQTNGVNVQEQGEQRTRSYDGGGGLLLGVLAMLSCLICVEQCYPLVPAFYGACCSVKRRRFWLVAGMMVGICYEMRLENMVKYALILIVTGLGIRVYQWINAECKPIAAGILAGVTTIALNLSGMIMVSAARSEMILGISEGLVVIPAAIMIAVILRRYEHSGAVRNSEGAEPEELGEVQRERITAFAEAAANLSGIFENASRQIQCWDGERQLLQMDGTEQVWIMGDGTAGLEAGRVWYDRMSRSRQNVAHQLQAMSELLMNWLKEPEPGKDGVEKHNSYYTLSGVATRQQDGAAISGDNFAMFESQTGSTEICLSDGMGSGSAASRESDQIVELLQELTEAGFEREKAVELVVSAMELQQEGDSFSTFDYSTIDLASGELQITKLGGAASFIVHGDEIITIQGIPFCGADGTVPKNAKYQLSPGDFLVMVSDGVLEYLHVREPEKKFREMLQKMNTENASRMAGSLLEQVLLFTAGKAADDMTIIVTGLWESR